MCSLLLAWRVLEETPIAIAANRDEAYDRPATGPRLLNGDPKVLAPLDQVAGGTWIGVNDYGVVIAIANRSTGPTGERSRGLLVRDLLMSESSDEARTLLATLLAEQTYAGFHLLLIDAFEGYYVTWDGDLTGHALASGVHVMDNGGLDEAASIPRRVRAELEPRVGETGLSWLERASATLADHDLGLCHHGAEHGTVSASRIVVSNGDTISMSFGFAPGPPCETEFVEVMPEGHI